MTVTGSVAVVLAAVAVTSGADGPPDVVHREHERPCPPRGAVVAVLSRTHELYLCRDGLAQERIRVAMGRRGMDKRRRDDGRTPTGTYTVGEPRPSRRFGTFIPIDYPTPEQVAQGYSGGGIGIHGPPRGWKDPVAAAALDWTTGCIATASDPEIERVARFVREHRPTAVIR